jgi:TolA-binding protein
MKKSYLLILICCISNINIFAAENKKEIHTFSEQEITALEQQIDYLNTEITKSKELIQQLKNDEINRLKQFDETLRLKYKLKDVGTGSASLNVLK